MSFKIQILFCFLLFSVIADAFNITAMLGQYSTYSTFNSYLTQTLVAGTINSRASLTVLAVSNDNIGSLSGKSGDDLMAIMCVHVVLDYYDVKKLQNMANQNITLTTLFQATGKAKGQQGFLVAIVSSSGDVSFTSAVAGSNNVGAKLVGSVASQPYNISVLQVSGVIVPPGVAGSPGAPPATNSSSTNSTTAPSPPPTSTATNSSTSPSSPPTSTATNSSTAPSSPPSSTPTSSSPVSAPSPNTSTTPSPTSAPKTSPTKSPLSPPAPTPTNASSPKASNSTAAPTASTVDAPAPSTDPTTASTDSPALSPDTEAAAATPPSPGTRLRLNLGAMSVVVLPTVCLMAMF